MTIRRDVALRIAARILLAVFVWCACCVAPAFARRYAMVIAVSKFDNLSDAKQLPYVENDAETMVETLEKLGFKVDAYCENGPREKAPTLKNIWKGFDYLAENVGGNDVVFIYVSTHGMAFADGRTYLLAKDSVVFGGSSSINKTTTEKVESNLRDTALSASELRKAASELDTKRVLLAFDACESAGSRGGYSHPNIDWIKLEGESPVATLASCSTKQSSGAINWSRGKDKNRISHFTYWLNEGLKGFADENFDGEVSIYELAAYVRANVENTCEILGATPQSPKFLASEIAEPFALAEVGALDRSVALEGIADQIAARLMKKSGEADARLAIDVSADFSDARTERVRDALGAFCKNMQTDLGERVKTKLKDADRDLKIVSDSFSKGEEGPTFRCKVKSDGESDDARFVLSGRLSGLKKSDESGADLPVEVGASIAYDAETNARLGEVVKPTRVADYSDAADVWLEIVDSDGNVVETRRPTSINGALWVPLDAGERYRIVYRLARVPSFGVGARVLVDGRNTLAQYEPYVPPTKVIVVGDAPEEENVSKTDDETEADVGSETSGGEIAIAAETVERSAPVETTRPRTQLDGAKFWVAEAPGAYLVEGFYERRGTDVSADGAGKAACRLFRVAPSDESTTGDCDDPGSILVAFYELHKNRGSGPRDLITVPDAEKPVSLIRVDGRVINEGQKPFACFSIRYASSAALERFRRDPDAFYSGDQTFYEEAETEDLDYH